MCILFPILFLHSHDCGYVADKMSLQSVRSSSSIAYTSYGEGSVATTTVKISAHATSGTIYANAGEDVHINRIPRNSQRRRRNRVTIQRTIGMWRWRTG